MLAFCYFYPLLSNYLNQKIMMKIYLSTFSLMVFTAVSFAQTIVSTSPKNKVAVLEEFTGLKCVYCPDGHKRANDLKAQYGDQMILVNIHAGSFAVPAAGEPDFRTADGETIDDQAGVTGYPAGSVNRVNTPWVGSRTNWAGEVATITAQSSPVNVGASANVDLNTGVLDVDVEVYYTANAADTTNKLFVYLLQDDLPGPQTGAANFYPEQILPNGDYNHAHMLRMVLNDNGPSGEVINATTATSLYTKSYQITLPADIRGVIIEKHKLKLVAFVASASGNNIYSGAETAVALPPGVTTDLSMTSNTTPNGDYCDYNATPEVTVTNNFNKTISAFDVSFYLNGTATTKSFSGTLATGGSTTVTFNSATLPGGVSKVSYGAPTNIVDDQGNGLIDTNSANNMGSIVFLYTVNTGTFDTELEEDFESSSRGDLEIDDAHRDESGGTNDYMVVDKDQGGVSQDLGAYGESDNSFRFDFYDWADGEIGAFYYDKLDLSNNEDVKISFDYAYANENSSSDASFKLQISTNCGSTWIDAWAKSGDDLETAGRVNGAWFYPEEDEWATAEIDAEYLQGQGEVILRLVGARNSGGNSLYFDNLRVWDAKSTGLANVEKTEIGISPIPTSDFVNISVAASNLSIVNALGQSVDANDWNATSTDNGVQLNVNKLESGVYFVQMLVDGEQRTERFVVAR
jgi:hypothetical protein